MKTRALALIVAGGLLATVGCEPVEPERGHPVVSTTAKPKKRPRGKSTAVRECERMGHNPAGKPVCVKWK